jgi:hypothetical protein
MVRFFRWFTLTLVVALVCGVEPAFAATAHAGAPAVPHLHAWLLGTGLVGLTLGTGVLTLADWAKRLDPNGAVPDIVELLSQSNEILLDMLFKEGNLPTGDRTTVRTGLPAVAWRLINGTTPTSKSTTAQVDEQCGSLDAWSEVDCKLAALNGNTAGFRQSEALAFIEAMNQEVAQTLFYGNAGLAPEEFTGLAARYSLSTAGNGKNVIKGGGAGNDNTSIYLVGWGPNSVHGIFPKGSKAGITHQDYGEVTIQGSTGIGGTRMRAYQEQFTWDVGISLKDWRHVVRICNIDISDLIANSGSQALLFQLMAKAIHRMPSVTAVRPAFYMNRTILEFLDIQATANVTSGGGLTFDNVDGKRVMFFRGIPLRTSDALLET